MITDKDLLAQIKETTFHVEGGKSVVCFITTHSGFQVEGFASVVDKAKFVESVGKEIAREKAMEKLRAYEAYRLQWLAHVFGNGKERFALWDGKQAFQVGDMVRTSCQDIGVVTAVFANFKEYCDDHWHTFEPQEWLDGLNEPYKEEELQKVWYSIALIPEGQMMCSENRLTKVNESDFLAGRPGYGT